MAAGLDRSKFRNPDMPEEYVELEAKFICEEEGIEFDDEYYVIAKILHEVNPEGREDYEKFTDMSFLTDSDEDISPKQEDTVECTGTEEPKTVSPSHTKEEKEAVIVKKEPDENDNMEKKSEDENKNQESNEASQLNDSLSKMEINPDKQKISKKPSKECRESDSSPQSRKRYRSQSCQSDHHGRVITYSSSLSPSPERYDMQIKVEPVEQPQHLFGSFYCDVCNITVNSELTFETHVIGKRHLKNVKMKNLPLAIAQSIPINAISEDDSKYPKPDVGIIRKKVPMHAAIQPTVNAKIRYGPCPGLNLVIEIRGLVNTTYYCSICDCTCASDSLISHLKGFKHQLNSVKYFKPNVYKNIQHEPKYKIEKEIQKILRAVQKKEGMGRISVEVDELASNNTQDLVHRMSEQISSTDYQNSSKGISRKRIDLPFAAKFHQASVPNQSASDFFCEVCQSHMNSSQMWESHIRGKRHLTNLKKNPGDLPSKTKTVPVKRRAVILDRIKIECPDEPIVGLKEVRETEIMETQSHSYQCFLCGSCHTSLDIIDHLKSLKHRTKYLDHINFPGREVIAGMSDIIAYGLVKDMCHQVVADEGPGIPAVHVNKNMLYR